VTTQMWLRLSRRRSEVLSHMKNLSSLAVVRWRHL